MDNDIVRTCSATYSNEDDNLNLLQCIVTSVQEDKRDFTRGLDTFFLIYASSLMFFMQAGFAMLCAGCVRRKNVQNTMLKNLLDACGAAIGFWSVGYAFAYGGESASEPISFLGHSQFFMIGVTDYARWFFQFAFAATSATIVAGTLAERSQMVAYICYSIVLTGFVYPVVAHAVWSENGFLSAKIESPLWGVGMLDFAGSGVVHVTGGMTALIATKVLGPRKDRFHDDSGNLLAKPRRISGHSSSLQVLGTFILWFGWYGFNSGSALSISRGKADVASLAAVCTTLSCASASLTSLTVSTILTERKTGEPVFDLTNALNGCLSGLVSITASCAVVEPWAAIVIGFVSGLNYLFFSDLLVRFKIDDVVDAIPVHLPNGIWGVISVGLFASPRLLSAAYGQDVHVGWFYSWGRGSADAILLAVNLLGLIFIFGWVTFTMTPFFVLLNYLGWLRADPLEEVVGLDITYHGGTAYQDHQLPSEILQMIESFRENNSKDVVVSNTSEMEIVTST